MKFITKKRLTGLIWTLLAHILIYILKVIFNPYLQTTNKIILKVMDNFGLLIAIIFAVICILLLIYWKFKDFKRKLESDIESLKQNSYNHAQNIMYIKKCYKKEKELSESDKYFIDRHEIGGVSSPSNQKFQKKVIKEINDKL
ncbi:MAG: hypothetical protein WC319_05965 [Candidatus Paceibacterota bacterium]|jgi:uncharacterized membrane protein